MFAFEYIFPTQPSTATASARIRGSVMRSAKSPWMLEFKICRHWKSSEEWKKWENRRVQVWDAKVARTAATKIQKTSETCYAVAHGQNTSARAQKMYRLPWECNKRVGFLLRERTGDASVENRKRKSQTKLIFFYCGQDVVSCDAVKRVTNQNTVWIQKNTYTPEQFRNILV